MKLGKLLDQLSKLDPELKVVLQLDPEGNGYSPCDGSDKCWWNGMDNEALSEEDREYCGYRKSELQECVVLYPRY